MMHVNQSVVGTFPPLSHALKNHDGWHLHMHLHDAWSPSILFGRHSGGITILFRARRGTSYMQKATAMETLSTTATKLELTLLQLGQHEGFAKSRQPSLMTMVLKPWPRSMSACTTCHLRPPLQIPRASFRSRRVKTSPSQE